MSSLLTRPFPVGLPQTFWLQHQPGCSISRALYQLLSLLCHTLLPDLCVADALAFTSLPHCYFCGEAALHHTLSVSFCSQSSFPIFFLIILFAPPSLQINEQLDSIVFHPGFILSVSFTQGCFLAIFQPQVTVFVLKIEHFNFVNSLLSSLHRASLVAQMAKESAYWRIEWMNLIWALGREGTLEKAMATHSSILAWKILWTKKPDRLQSIGP